jgi:hypothetical protein
MRWRAIVQCRSFIEDLGAKALTKADMERLFGYVLLKGVQWRHILAFEMRPFDVSGDGKLLPTSTPVEFKYSSGGWRTRSEDPKILRTLSLEVEDPMENERAQWSKVLTLEDALSTVLKCYARRHEDEPCVHLEHRPTMTAFNNKYARLVDYKTARVIWAGMLPDMTIREAILWAPLNDLKWRCIHKKAFRAVLLSWLQELLVSNTEYFRSWVYTAAQDGLLFSFDE